MYDQKDLQINQDEPEPHHRILQHSLASHCAQLLRYGNQYHASNLSIKAGPFTISFERTIRVPRYREAKQYFSRTWEFPA
jgi:hypothetical protein